MFRFSLLTAAFVFTGVAAWAAPRPIAPPDSVGVEYRGNKLLIKHRVTPGETLYGVARRYKVPVEDIVEANAGQKGALVTGQVILVPRNRVVLTQPAAPKATAAAPAASRALPTDARGNRVYKVEPGVTLFAIARRFQTTPAELARLNGFPANYNVRVGETVIVAGSAAKAAAPVAAAPSRPAPTARPERDEEAEREARETREREARERAARDKEARDRAARERARDSAASPAVTPTTPAATAAAPVPEKEKAPTRASEIVRRVSESGLATVIQTDASDKYLALHKTAPVGTIMEVKNIMNGQSVYVRVIGQLPDTGENTNILVRLSKRAVQRLATPDQRFRVETNYVP